MKAWVQTPNQRRAYHLILYLGICAAPFAFEVDDTLTHVMGPIAGWVLYFLACVSLGGVGGAVFVNELFDKLLEKQSA